MKRNDPAENKWIGISFSESNRNKPFRMKNGEQMFRKIGQISCAFFPLFRSLLWNVWLETNYMLLWVYKIVSRNGSQLIRASTTVVEWIENKKAIDTCLHFFFSIVRVTTIERQRVRNEAASRIFPLYFLLIRITMLGHKTWFSARFLSIYLFCFIYLPFENSFGLWRWCNVGQGPLILLSLDSLLETRQMRYMITIVLQ